MPQLGPAMRRADKVWVRRQLAHRPGPHLSPQVFSARMGQPRARGLLSACDQDIGGIPTTSPTESSTITAGLFWPAARATALPIDTPWAPKFPTAKARAQLALAQRIPATGKARTKPPEERDTDMAGIRVPVAPSPPAESGSDLARPSDQERSAEKATGHHRTAPRNGRDTAVHQARSKREYTSCQRLVGVLNRELSEGTP